MTQHELAIYYLDKHALGRAIHHFCKWILTHPDDFDAHRELIWCFNQRRNNIDYVPWRECDDFYKKVYNLANELTLKLFVKAEQLTHEEKYEDALERYQAALMHAPKVNSIHFGLAKAYFALMQYKKSATEFENILDSNPTYLPALYRYCFWMFAEGRCDRIESYLTHLDDSHTNKFLFVYKDEREDFEELLELKKAVTTLKQTNDLIRKHETKEAFLNIWQIFLRYRTNVPIIRTITYLIYLNDWLPFGQQFCELFFKKDSPHFYYAKGLVCWYEDKFKNALKNYNKAISLGLEHPLVYCARALVLEKLNREIQEQKDLAFAHDRQPWLTFARTELAYNAFHDEDYDTVIGLSDMDSIDYQHAFQYEVSGDFNSAVLQTIALKSYMKKGNYQEALSVVERDKYPLKNEFLLLRRAMVYAVNKEFNEAAKELAAAIEIDAKAISDINDEEPKLLKNITKKFPDHFPAKLTLALLPAYEENYKKSIDRLLKLSKNYPNNHSIWYHIAIIASILEKHKMSKEACKKALSLNPTCKKTIRLLCNILSEEGDIKGLIDLGDELLAETIPYEYALDLVKSNDAQEQLKTIAKKCLERDPEHYPSIRYLLKITDQKNPEFIWLYDRLNSILPIESRIRFSIASEFFERGMFKESSKRFIQLFEDGFDSLHGILQMGMAQLIANDNKQ